ncbi:MAG: Ger(x)C family spore germination C-terminal domain-containing protein, partial [Bacilli bacterium]|nr:Ger(x)C family spore germination C-terminal domain-containing protein [Bacilli bacterium]
MYHKDKFQDYLPFKENLMINIVNNKVKEMKTVFTYQNKKIGFSSDNIKTKTKIKDYKTVEITVTGEGAIAETNNNIDLENPKVMKKIENSLNKNVKKRIKKVIKKMQNKYHTDVFGFGNKLYKQNPKQWQKIEKNWNNYYFSNLNIKVKTKIKITKKG